MPTDGAKESDATSGSMPHPEHGARADLAQAFQARWQRIVPMCLIGLLALFGIGAYLTGKNNLQITQWVDHTYEVRLETLRLHGLLFQAQSLQSVYADTKSDEVHAQLGRALAAIPVS